MELRTPLGCRDILADDCSKRDALCANILKTFERFGFRKVQTPAMEYYQTYNQTFYTLQDGQIIKLIDGNQDILSLRLDMTVPIARLAATALKNAQFPLRLCYQSDVWKVRKAYTGRSSQSTDCGVELIGSKDDHEIVICALEALESTGLDQIRLEFSDARLVSLPASHIFSDPEDVARLSDLIDRKSMVELAQFLDEKELEPDVRNYFLNLPLLDGGIEVLDQARSLAFDAAILPVLDELEELMVFLDKLGYGNRIGLDLGKLPHLNYYTGLIFEGFAKGAAVSILSGGRYDNLMAAFGSDHPAIGFAFKIDPLADLMPDPEKKKPAKISYPLWLEAEAFAAAGNLRKNTAVIMERNDELEEVVLEGEFE